MLDKRYHWRVELTIVLIGLCFLFLIYRLFSIQVIEHHKYLALQEAQSYLKIEVPAPLGVIFDRNGELLAVSNTVDSLYAVPSLLKKEPALIIELAQILKLPPEEIQDKVNKAAAQKRHFIWLKRYLTDEESKNVAGYKSKSIGLRQEYKRFYPNDHLASHVLGFRGIDEQALAGLELGWDQYLKGTPGYYSTPRDARQKNLTSLDLMQSYPQPGNDIYLTIDLVLQFILEEELELACQKWKAQKAIGIMLNPQTGEILALANRPDFDPNRYQDYPPTTWRNYALSDIYEPGSVFKPFIASAALDEKIVSLSDRFFCENGTFKTGYRTIHDHQPYGWLAFTEILINSSNIGMSKIGIQLGPAKMYDYLKRFDFDKTPGSGLPGETSGLITPYTQWNDYTITSVPWGHEIGVSALQLAKSFAVFANNGYLLRPQIVFKITNPQGVPVKTSRTEVIRQPICSSTATKMRSVLTAVVNHGTGTSAQIPGYQVAGKTGTAQKLEGKHGYSHAKFVSYFIGFAPAANPHILVLVIIDEPQGAYYGGKVVAPVVGSIIQKSLTYLKAEHHFDTTAKRNSNVIID